MELTTQQTILMTFIQGLDEQQAEDVREILDNRVHDAKEAEGMSCAPSQNDEDASDDEHLAIYSQQASEINNQGFEAQINYLVSLGHFDTLCFALEIPTTDVSVSPDDEFSDDWVKGVFVGTNFGDLYNQNPTLQKELLAKTLRNQMRGLWSGHTAYHLVVAHQLLQDGRSGTLKSLTDKGRRFLDYMRPRLSEDFFF